MDSVHREVRVAQVVENFLDGVGGERRSMAVKHCPQVYFEEQRRPNLFDRHHVGVRVQRDVATMNAVPATQGDLRPDAAAANAANVKVDRLTRRSVAFSARGDCGAPCAPYDAGRGGRRGGPMANCTATHPGR